MDALKSFLVEFGEVNGLLILAAVAMFLWVRRTHHIIFRQYEARIADLKDQIDRLAKDNRAYREKYLKSTEQSVSGKRKDRK